MKPKEILHDHQMSRAHSRVYAAVVAAAFSAALLMAGCAVGPEYQPPVVELNALRAQARHLSASDAAPIERWWEGFHDPLLNRLVQDGLARNLDLAVAAARVSQARAYLDQSQAALLPSIEADGSAASQRLSLNSAAGRAAPSARRTHSEYSAGLQASWELDLFGSLRRQAGAASALADEAGASQAAVQISVAADIADAYLSIRGLQQEIGSARGEVGAAERLLDLVQRRISAGASNDLELAQSQALLYQARASLPPLRAALDAQLNRLSILLGKQPGAVDSELRPAGTIPSAPDLPAELSPADLLRRRPDVVAAERHLAASSELIGAAIAEYYPKLSLSLSGGFDTVAGGRLFDSDSAQHIGAAGFRWRLFDFGRIDAEVRRAKGANVEALALYRKAILKAVEDVENAVTAFNEGQQRVDHVRLQVAALDRAQHLAEESYKLGAVSLIEVVDAQRQLLASRIILHQSSADASRSAVALYRAVGGGWK